jgi:hypothetical protein
MSRFLRPPTITERAVLRSRYRELSTDLAAERDHNDPGELPRVLLHGAELRQDDHLGVCCPACVAERPPVPGAVVVTVALTVEHDGALSLEELPDAIATALESTGLRTYRENDYWQYGRATITEANAVGEAVAI